MLEFIKFWIYAYVSYVIASLMLAGVVLLGILGTYSLMFLFFGVR